MRLYLSTMPLFIVTISRTETREIEVEIEAEHEGSAESIALNRAGNFDFPPAPSADYKVEANLLN